MSKSARAPAFDARPINGMKKRHIFLLIFLFIIKGSFDWGAVYIHGIVWPFQRHLPSRRRRSVENAKPARFIKCWEMSKKSKPSVGDFIGSLIHRLVFCTITDLRQTNVANFLKHRGEIHIFSIWFEKHVQVLPNHCWKPTRSFAAMERRQFRASLFIAAVLIRLNAWSLN